MAVAVTSGASFVAATPAPLFQLRIIPFPPTQPRMQYAATAKGDRFLVNNVVKPTAPSPVTIVLNWSAALKQ